MEWISGNVLICPMGGREGLRVHAMDDRGTAEAVLGCRKRTPTGANGLPCRVDDKKNILSESFCDLSNGAGCLGVVCASRKSATRPLRKSPRGRAASSRCRPISRRKRPFRCAQSRRSSASFVAEA
jgi:hypothetical protein